MSSCTPWADEWRLTVSNTHAPLRGSGSWTAGVTPAPPEHPLPVTITWLWQLINRELHKDFLYYRKVNGKLLPQIKMVWSLFSFQFVRAAVSVTEAQTILSPAPPLQLHANSRVFDGRQYPCSTSCVCLWVSSKLDMLETCLPRDRLDALLPNIPQQTLKCQGRAALLLRSTSITMKRY